MEARKLQFTCEISSVTSYGARRIHHMNDPHDTENDKGDAHADEHGNKRAVERESDGGWVVHAVHAAPFSEHVDSQRDCLAFKASRDQSARFQKLPMCKLSISMREHVIK